MKSSRETISSEENLYPKSRKSLYFKVWAKEEAPTNEISTARGKPNKLK